METSLALHMDKKQSDAYLENALSESLNSLATKLNFAIHILANK